MRALITADLHLNDNVRDSYRHLFLRTFRDLCRKHKVDTAIVLGDLTDAKDKHSAWLVNQVVDYFHRLAGICENVIVLMGNHDYSSENLPFFKLLQRLERVYYVYRPIAGINAPTPVFRSLGRHLWLPHTANPKKEWAGLDTQGAELIFAHQTFNGANVGFGRKLEGIDPDELLPGKARIISGDIHVPQTFGRVTYVGSPYLVDFGDDFEPRILLLDGNKTTSILCDGPQKRLIEATSIEDAKRECEKVAAEGDILKLRIAVDSIEHWPETREAIREWCTKQGLVPHIVQPLLKAKSSMASKQTVSAARSDVQVLNDYGRLRKVEEPVLKTGLSLLEET
jgi:DNA repair exonuclease SbcCD nuclease subunit